MPRQIEIVIPGKARGKERPRATRSGVVFTPAKTRNAEAFVKSCAMDAIGGAPLLDGPLRMGLEVVVEIPTSWPKREKEAAIAGTKRPTGRPDLDNICKLVADSLNGIVYRDDAAIVSMTLTKRYGDRAETWVCIAEVAA